MKFTSSLAMLAGSAAAFPFAALENAMQNDPELAARANAILNSRQTGADAASLVFEPESLQTFSESQLIDVSAGSGHEYVAPSGTDNRGPCPGLNAFANHNFLPHNGYATIAQFIDVTTNVVGMGPVLAAFLAVFGAAIDGDGTAWSIGGTPTIAQAGVLGNQAHGISGSHNKYESDVSPTRPDLYEYGNDYLARPQQFAELMKTCPTDVNIDCLTAFRAQRFDESIAGNPRFFNGPFTGVLVQPAAFTFIYRFMANHSEENKIGYLSHEVIQSWFAMKPTGKGKYKSLVGQERIPNNWYRRSLTVPYENTYFFADVGAAAALHPKFLNVGGNTGKVNTFSGVDISDLTGGALNSKSLLKGDKFACLAAQAAAQIKPDIALNALALIQSALGSLTKSLNCPQINKIDNSQLKKFPGSGTSSGGV